jgi:hypothetical protein
VLIGPGHVGAKNKNRFASKEFRVTCASVKRNVTRQHDRVKTNHHIQAERNWRFPVTFGPVSGSEPARRY